MRNADVRYYDATFYGVSVVKNKNGPGYFVGLPVRFGSKKSFLIVEVAEPDRSSIQWGASWIVGLQATLPA